MGLKTPSLPLMTDRCRHSKYLSGASRFSWQCLAWMKISAA